MAEPFIGEIRLFPYNFAPRGWAFCDGQLLPIAENTALFSLIGTIYGGDGRTTMGLPNLVSRAALAEGRGPGLSYYRLGERSGTPMVTLSEAQLPTHNHAANVMRALGTSGEPSNTLMAGIDNVPTFRPYVKDAASTQKIYMSLEMLSTSGGGQAHENRQPFLVIPFCIALMGLYPSRS
ncbi:phage tail protein [Aliikangiella sp. IMCC44359]|uniref:phage tail protein n=1 Tax=Aliikangiella sp. IMCC44359 TaxID=3459125 RepID=UPI00403B09A7